MKESFNKITTNFNDVRYVSKQNLFKFFPKKQAKLILATLQENKLIFKQDNSTFIYKNSNIHIAKITRIFQNFSFARTIDDIKFFIPNKFRKKAIFNDIVILKELYKHNSKSKEAKVFKVCSTDNPILVGTTVKINEKIYVKSDENFEGLFKTNLPLKTSNENIKVLIKIERKNFDIKNPSCILLKKYGTANSAYNCCKAFLNSQKISLDFPKKVTKEIKRLSSKPTVDFFKNERFDLTKKTIFTIDSESSKDLDDAVSVEIIDNKYLVGIHISDVSNYVHFKSELDKEAFKRGNSVYFANKVIPMFPEFLSNNICSLQPKKVRLTFSIFILFDKNGNIISFDFKKTKIKSILKATYEEVNQILKNSFKNNTQKNKILKKYSKILKDIKILRKLCVNLKKLRELRGSPNLNSSECEIKLNKNDKIISIESKYQNEAEQIIEELMIAANVCVAKFMKQNKLPALYRTHDEPSKEKLKLFKIILNRLNLKSIYIKSKPEAKDFAKLIKKSKDSELSTFLNLQILKTMSKAKYETEPSSHYGLVLNIYTHFTSPIRRYCDLLIHRILTDFLFKNESIPSLNKKFKKYLEKSEQNINIIEKNTLKNERICESFYKAEFMSNKINKKFNATICNFNNKGIFIKLDNTIEGFIKIDSLNQPFYFDGYCKLKSKDNKIQYIIGQQIKVRCVSVDIDSRKIDFVIDNYV